MCDIVNMINARQAACHGMTPTYDVYLQREARDEIVRLRAELKKRSSPESFAVVKRELDQARAEISDLSEELNTFKAAVEHVTEPGTAKRTFTADGWTMSRCARYMDLLVAEEANKELSKTADRLTKFLEAKYSLDWENPLIRGLVFGDFPDGCLLNTIATQTGVIKSLKDDLKSAYEVAKNAISGKYKIQYGWSVNSGTCGYFVDGEFTGSSLEQVVLHLLDVERSKQHNLSSEKK